MIQTMTAGEKIKERRKERGLTQGALAEGICTQATISNLESKGSIPTLNTLSTILERLDMNVKDFLDSLKMDTDDYSSVFKEVKNLCGQVRHKEAQELLLTMIDFDQITNEFQKKQYYYYLGITAQIGEKDYSDAHYNFNQALFISSSKEIDSIDILATNGIAVTYYLENEMNKAETYFNKSVQQLDEITEEDSYLLENDDITKVYFNSAKFYSAIGLYQKALDLCELGINLRKQHNDLIGMEHLLYEKAFNLFKLGDLKQANDFYYYASSFAKFNENADMLKTIKKDAKEFKLKEITYLR